MVFGVFSPERTQCIAPKKLPDKAMSIWNLHKKFQLSSAMGLRDFDLQSQPTLMGGNPLIVVQWVPDGRESDNQGPVKSRTLDPSLLAQSKLVQNPVREAFK